VFVDINKRTDIFGVPHVDEFAVPSIPYMGSKRRIATKILNAIYKTVGDFETLYDLFGGGAAMSVAGVLAGHRVFYNDANAGVSNLFRHIVSGGAIPKSWVSRELFHDAKNGNDWYSGLIKCCWSFGSDQSSYLFGKEIEDIKRAAHEYLLSNGYDGTMESRKNLLQQFKVDQLICDRFDLQRLEQLERLERLQQLEQLERLERLEILNCEYCDIKTLGGAVVYCDPPYFNTQPYQCCIDYEKFYQWCFDTKSPVFVSSYNLPECFVLVASFSHRSTLGATANNAVVENLYWNGKRLQEVY